MAEFTAEYRLGEYGTSICMANTISELLKTLSNRGYKYDGNEKKRIIDWAENTDKYRYYGARLRITRGELQMTEYTSF